MPPEFDPQAALTSLRSEIQNDRLALQAAISDGFERVLAKFDEHSRSDVSSFAVVEKRLTTMETKIHLVGGGLWALTLASVGSVVSLIVWLLP